MLKRFTAILLVAAMVCSSFQWVMVCAGFQLNRSYIAANLCVNRNKPWMHCNGKCYFMQKLKQAREKEKNVESQDQKNLVQQVFHTSPELVKFHSQLLCEIPIPNGRLALPQVLLSVFRPPAIA